MARIYGKELRESIMKDKERLIAAIERRAERIANWETDEDDCFMSQRVEEQGISECNMQLAILDGDGLGEFEVVKDSEGNEIRTHWVHTRYGWKIVANGIFANSLKALLKKTGWHTEIIKAPIWTKFVANGSGLMGVYSGSYQTVRWHTNMVTGEYVGYPD